MTMTIRVNKNPNKIDSGTIALYGTSVILILLGLGITARKISDYKTKSKLYPSGQRIFLLGDSLAVGLRPYLAKLSSNNNAIFDSNAIGGTSINQWAHKSWIQKAIDFKPTISLISLGTNDAYAIDMYGHTIEDTLDKDIQTVLNKLSSSAINIWVMPPNITKFNSMPSVRYHIVKSGVKVINSQLFDIKMSGDGVHPMGKGYETWANDIWKSIFE